MAHPAVLSERRHGAPPLPYLPPGGDRPFKGSERNRKFRDTFRLGDFKLPKPPDDGEAFVMNRLRKDNMRTARMREAFQKAQRMNEAAGSESKCLRGPCRPNFELPPEEAASSGAGESGAADDDTGESDVEDESAGGGGGGDGEGAAGGAGSGGEASGEGGAGGTDAGGAN
eukprot:g2120.t1